MNLKEILPKVEVKICVIEGPLPQLEYPIGMNPYYGKLVTIKSYNPYKSPRPNSSHGCAKKIGSTKYEDEYHFLKRLRNIRCCKKECLSRIPNGSLSNAWHVIKFKGENEITEFVLKSL